MRTDFTGAYPADWKSIATAVKEAAGWRCVRCGHEHDPATGYTLTVLSEFLFPAIISIGARYTVTARVLVAGMAQTLPKWLRGTPAVSAWLWRLLTLPVAMRQELIQATIHDHVTATTEDGNVFRFVVPGIAIPMVTICGRFPALLAFADRICALCPRALGLWSCGITLPFWVGWAANGGEFSDIFSVGTRLTCSALIPITSDAKAAAQGLVGLLTIRACVHGTNYTSNGVTSQRNGV